MHPVIVVLDLGRSLRFYGDLLGLQIKHDAVHDPAMAETITGYESPDIRAVVLQAADGSEVELVEFRRPAARPGIANDWAVTGIRSVTFAINDVSAAASLLESMHVPIKGDVIRQIVGHGPVSETIYCEDPDGVIVTLSTRPIT